MRKALVSLVVLTILSLNTYSQDDLFGTGKKPSRQGFIFSLNGNYDLPGGDMAKRFGKSWRVGSQIFYKTKSNWVFGPKVDLIFGSDIKEDSLLSNLRDNTGAILGIDGKRLGVGVFERGYMIGLQAGRILNVGKKSSDNGFMFLTSAGFMQHKITIYDQTQSIPTVAKDKKKGYDRLTNGIYLEEYICYSYFSDNGLINFHIGLDITAGFTQGRRDWLWDVMRPDDKKRVDLLFGVRGGWYLPIFKRKSEEFFFE